MVRKEGVSGSSNSSGSMTSNHEETRKRRPRSIPMKLAEYSMNVDFLVDAIDTSSYLPEKNDPKNRDVCECCGDGGDLLCCDNCPASFHFVCVDPPMEPSAVPEGDWYCKECAVKKNPSLLLPAKGTPPAITHLIGPLLKQLTRTNPRVFQLPPDLYAMCTAARAARIAENNRKEAIVTCTVCTVDGASDELLSCAMCRHSYHTYCLEPPLLSKPPYWVCPEHEGADLPFPKGIKRARTDKYVGNSNNNDVSGEYNSINIKNGHLLRKGKAKITHREQMHFLPGETLKLDFKPSPYPNDIPSPKPIKRHAYNTYSFDPDDVYTREQFLERYEDIDTQTTPDEQTNLLLNLSAGKRTGHSVEYSSTVPMDTTDTTDTNGLDLSTAGITGPNAHPYVGRHTSRIDTLIREQQRLLNHALPNNTLSSIASNNNNNILPNNTPLMLSQLTPLFTQFLAWQRLMQLNKQIYQVTDTSPPEFIPLQTPSVPPQFANSSNIISNNNNNNTKSINLSNNHYNLNGTTAAPPSEKTVPQPAPLPTPLPNRDANSTLQLDAVDVPMLDVPTPSPHDPPATISRKQKPTTVQTPTVPAPTPKPTRAHPTRATRQAANQGNSKPKNSKSKEPAAATKKAITTLPPPSASPPPIPPPSPATPTITQLGLDEDALHRIRRASLPSLLSILEGPNITYPNPIARLEAFSVDPPKVVVFDLFKKGTVVGRAKRDCEPPDVDLSMMGPAGRIISHIQACRNPTKVNGAPIEGCLAHCLLPTQCTISISKVQLKFTQLQS